jgi:hypothetical protein
LGKQFFKGQLAAKAAYSLQGKKSPEGDFWGL